MARFPHKAATVAMAATLLAGAGLSSAVLAAPTGLTDDRNARDLTHALTWFEGEFSNDLQIWFEADPRSHTAPADRQQRYHHLHQRLPDDLLGSPSFLVTEKLGEGEQQSVRQHVVAFASQKPDDGIRMVRYRWNRGPDGSAGTAADSMPRADALEKMVGCDVVLQRRGAQLEGRSEAANCDALAPKASGLMAEEMWLGTDVFSFRRSPSKPSRQAAPPALIPLYKARHFDCDVSMFADSYLAPSPQDRTYHFKGRHDLGDMMVMESPRDGKSYYLQLRRQRYPYYTSGGEFLLMRLREVGAPSSAAVMTFDTSNEGMSLNLGWVMADCRLQNG